MEIFWAISITIIGIVPVFVIGYWLSAYVLARVPIQKKIPITEQKNIFIWIISNGVHTDICVPLKHSVQDWTQIIDTQEFTPASWQYAAFGWGDKGFFLDTPTWAELKASVAFKALFKLGTTAMHVSLHETLPTEKNKWQAGLWISPAQYALLADYIRRSFQYDKEGKPMKIEFAGLPAYDHLNDNFYEAVGQYHFFKTCNCWVNEALKTAGVKVALWSPFANTVFEFLDTETTEIPTLPLAPEV